MNTSSSSNTIPAPRHVPFSALRGMVALVTLALVATLPGLAKGGRAGATGTIYVGSQGLFYDTFIVVDLLPMEGDFQLLINGTTDFGPGDAEYRGGRFWEDTNGSGFQDEGDRFFLSPLVGPGRAEP
jgi:hypothetical protein